MSTVKCNNAQIGQSVTATNNFTWYQPASPDGTVRLGNGNSGSVTDVLTVGTTGNLTLTGTAITLSNSAVISAASTKTLTLNGDGGTNGLVLAASNNVGIGTASPAQKLEVAGIYARVNPTTGTQQSAWLASNTGGDIYFGLENSTGTNFNTGTGYAGVVWRSGANPICFVNNATEKMRLDSSGNLGLGVTPAGYGRAEIRDTAKAQLSVYGYSPGGGASDLNGAIYVGASTAYQGRIYYDAVTGSLGQLWIENVQSNSGSGINYKTNGGPHKWFLSFTQAMTLDASGNLIVGDTSVTGQRIYAKSATTDGTTYATVLRNSASTLLLYVRSDGYVSTGTAAASPYNNTSGSAANLYVDAAGLLYRSTSSARYKNSITDAVHGLAEVLKLRPVTYKGNNDGDTVFGGLIAEEVHDAGLTEFVQYNDDGEPDALAYGNMVSLAFKAIQELSVELNDLKQKVNA